jgi:alpha-tubulin suppressor-like RCC1 family protein
MILCTQLVITVTLIITFANGQAYVWGGNNNNQLGIGNNATQRTPTSFNFASMNKTIVAMAAGGGYFYTGITTTSAPYFHCWSTSSSSSMGYFLNSCPPAFSYYHCVNDVSGSSSVGYIGECAPPYPYYHCGDNILFDDYVWGGCGNSNVIFAGGHTVVLTSDAMLYSWGKNDFGQLGTGNSNPTASLVPVDTSGVLLQKNITMIAAGWRHTLVLTSDNKVYAWGCNFSGQLGYSSSANQLVPVAVNMSPSNKATSIAAGWQHSVALTVDGRVFSWGSNVLGQLGAGNFVDSVTPIQVTGLLSANNITAIAAGGHFTIALSAGFQLFSWGANKYGQLGIGNNSNLGAPVAVNMTGVFLSKKISAIAAGGFHALALTTDGSLYAWGYNYYGQIGSGDVTGANQLLPVAVNMSGILANKIITSVTAGGLFTTVLTSDGRLYSWGRNDFGQLGTGNTIDQYNPVAVNMSKITIPVGSIESGYSHTLAVNAAAAAVCRTGYVGNLCNISVCYGKMIDTFYDQHFRRKRNITFGLW